MRVPIVVPISQANLKHLYLFCVAQSAARDYHNGSFCLLLEVRKKLQEFGYSKPDQILSEIYKNPLDIFILDLEGGRIFFRSPEKTAAKIMEAELPKIKQPENWPLARLNCAIMTVKIKKERFTLVDFKAIYTELTAARPSAKAQEAGPLVEAIPDRDSRNRRKSKRKILDPQRANEYRKENEKQEIDALPGGRTVKSIAEEVGSSERTVIRRLKKNETIKVNRRKDYSLFVLFESGNSVNIGQWNSLVKKETFPPEVILVPCNVPANTVKVVSMDYPGNLFIKEQTVETTNYDNAKLLKAKLDYFEYEFNVPYIRKRTKKLVTAICNGQEITVSGSVFQHYRDLANVYSTQFASIDNVYVIESTPPNFMSTIESTKPTNVHLRPSQMNIELAKKVRCGQEGPLHLRRMSNWECRRSRSQTLNYRQVPEIHKIVYKAKTADELIGLQLPPLATRYNKLPKSGYSVISQEIQ